MLSTLLRAALVGAAAAALAPAANALSSVHQGVAAGNLQVQYPHQTTSRLKREAWNAAGELLQVQTCTPLGSACFTALPNGTAKWAVSLEGFNPAREEVTGERCNNVGSTVPQLYCVNGDLELWMRPRVGDMKLTLSAPAPLLLDNNGSTMRMVFADDDTKYWEFPAGSRNNAPAGSFRLVADPLKGHCAPEQTNPGEAIDIPAGGSAAATLTFKGTRCTIWVNKYYTGNPQEGTLDSDAGAFTCGGPGLVGNQCRVLVDHGKTVRIRYTPAPGTQAGFSSVNSACTKPLADPLACDVLADNDRQNSLSIWLASTPPAPLPVELTVARGAQAPIDRSADKGAVDVPLLQLRAVPANGTAMLNALTLRAAGSGRDDLDLLDVRVIADANGNGVVDAGEAVLGHGRLSADDGSLRLVLDTPLALSAPQHLLVVADIAGSVHTAAAAGTALLAFALVAVPAMGRRHRLLLVVAAALVLLGCGGGAAEPEAPAPQQPAPPAPTPPVVLSYRIDLTAVEATDAVTPANTLAVTALPIAGATLSVTQ